MREQAKKFGTFGGVFIPSILTIFGVVMFRQFGEVLGTLGITGGLIILCLAEAIAISTALSISAISTNTEVGTGGAYFLISRALGPSFGGAIGLCLFLSQAAAIPFYITGFTESFLDIFPQFRPWLLLVNLVPLVIMFIISITSTDLAIKTQYFIFTILMLAIIAFLGGAFMTIRTNGIAEANPWLLPDPADLKHPCFYFFAIFFPAVTGFLSGVNMSGDLSNPNRSLPRGTIAAILFGMVIYAVQIILTGLAFPHGQLAAEAFTVLKSHALFGTGYLVAAGVIAATLSSALGSHLGAPRVLQALAHDKIFTRLAHFDTCGGTTNIPRRATCLTFLLAAIILIWASLQTKSDNRLDPLHILTETVTMINLFTYALINLAAFVESVGANPSFRPTFKCFNWRIAFFGFSACIIVAININQPIAYLAMLLLIGIYALSKPNASKITFGDARRGFLFSRIRSYLFSLKRMPVNSKNWRPRFAVLVNQRYHGHMLKFADMFNNQRGLTTAVCIIPPNSENSGEDRRQATAERIEQFAQNNGLEIFSHVISAENTDTAIDIYLQSVSNSPILPNIIMCGWPHDASRLEAFTKHIQTVIDLDFNCVIAANCDIPINNNQIDIWWRGHQNGSLMIILAYLLTQNQQFKNRPIRLLRIAAPDAVNTSRQELQALVEAARIKAEIKIIPDDRPFQEIFREESYNSAAVFLGFIRPEKDAATDFIQERTSLLDSMPITFMVYSNGTADLTK